MAKDSGHTKDSGKAASIWTPANIVTCIRVVMVPVWLAVAELSVASVGTNVSVSALVTMVLFALISLTDKVDGYLARSRGEVTTFGKFLDPIADKLVVIVALCFLLENGLVSSWVVLVVITREFVVSGLRMVVASQGVVIAASNLGKWKTATTMVALCGLLLARALPEGMLYLAVWGISFVALIAAVILTIWSGFDYCVKSWPALTVPQDES